MKIRKSIFVFVLALIGLSAAQAQGVSFGLKGGYLQGYGKVETGGVGVTVDEGGFFVGALAEIELPALNLQPELVYGNIDEGDFLLLPIMLKKNFPAGFNLQAGPQFAISLEDLEGADDISRASLDFAFGAGYDFPKKFFIDARYSLQITNTYTGDLDITARTNFLTLGVGLRF